MRITQVSTNDISGGAARAAYRLHTGLRKLGHDSRMLVAHKASEDSNVALFQPSRDLPSRVRRRLLSSLISRSWSRLPPRPPGATFFSDDRSSFGAEMVEQLPPCDILQLHWISSFVDYRKFFSRIPRNLPIVWTLHDMNPFTGGCHYSGDCGKFRASCGACPELLSAVPEDFSAQSWRRKQQALSYRDERGIQIVTPSRWLAEQARTSSLFANMHIEVIPNGVDTEKFQPRDRRSARESYGIPPEAKVVLFVADWASEKRKGSDLLLAAAQGMISQQDLYFATIGRGSPLKSLGEHAIAIDYVRDDVALSSIYSAANAFVLPSVQDNLPNTALEALACGVPIVAFAAGGLPDIVRDGETGVLAPPGDVGALRAAITKVLQDPHRQAAMAESCRRTALAEYKLDVQAKRYMTLYESLLPAGAGSAKPASAR